MVKESSGEKPKRKRGRPKGSKKKPKKEPKIEAKPESVEEVEPVEKPESVEEVEQEVEVKKPTKTISQAVAASENAWKAAEKAAAEAEAAQAKLAAAKTAAEKATKEEYEVAAAEAVVEEDTSAFTNKRGQDVIFRREMGEPEFWLEKNERAPPTAVLSKDEEEEISRQVQIPTDNTPVYNPEHMLSPEFHGTSNYELGIKKQREEIEQRLERLRNDPNASIQEIALAEEDLKTLDYLYENFNIGMNVFRTAKGGRSKLRE